MERVKSILPDALIVAGAGFVSYGVWVIYPAAGFITAGVLMLAGGAVAATNIGAAKDEK